MNDIVVTVTRKGQATIPKEFRRKYGIGTRVIVVDTGEGVLIRPAPNPLTEKGSLRDLFKGMTSKQLIEESRSEEVKREKRLLLDDSK